MTTAFSTLVASAEQGDRAAADTLFAALYDELHRMARRELARRGSGVTLGATTLLHEAYLDISDREGAAFPDRNRFMAYASVSCEGSSSTTHAGARHRNVAANSRSPRLQRTSAGRRPIRTS